MTPKIKLKCYLWVEISTWDLPAGYVKHIRLTRDLIRFHHLQAFSFGVSCKLDK